MKRGRRKVHRAVKRAFRQRFISEIDAIPSRESNCAIFGNAGETIVREEEEEDDDELRALVERRQQRRGGERRLRRGG